MKSNINHYLALNYPIELIRDVNQGGFFATHPDLPGCAAQGETAEEAIASLDDARKLWIESRLEDDLPVPVPLSDQPSGKVLLRMARSLHAELAKHAARQGISLNLLINTVLAEYTGGAGYRAELAVFQQSVETLRSAVTRVSTTKGAESGWPGQRGYISVTDNPGSPFEDTMASTYSAIIDPTSLSWSEPPPAALLRFRPEKPENERRI